VGFGNGAELKVIFVGNAVEWIRWDSGNAVVFKVIFVENPVGRIRGDSGNAVVFKVIFVENAVGWIRGDSGNAVIFKVIFVENAVGWIGVNFWECDGIWVQFGSRGPFGNAMVFGFSSVYFGMLRYAFRMSTGSNFGGCQCFRVSST